MREFRDERATREAWSWLSQAPAPTVGDPPGLRRRVEGAWGFTWRLCASVLKPILLLVTRTTWSGMSRVPADGGCILAVNHISPCDPVTLADALLFGAGRIPSFMAKAVLFDKVFLGPIMRGARQIPVYRDRPDGGGALDAAVRALHDGACIVIYPEGTVSRNPEGWPMAARTGVARLALESGVDVYPVGQWGAQQLMSRRPAGHRRRWPRVPARVSCLVGPPVDLAAWRGEPLTPQTMREVTAAIMTQVTACVAELRGQAPPEGPAYDPRVA